VTHSNASDVDAANQRTDKTQEFFPMVAMLQNSTPIQHSFLWKSGLGKFGQNHSMGCGYGCTHAGSMKKTWHFPLGPYELTISIFFNKFCTELAHSSIGC
jgi:hypothetical protein